MLAILGKTFGKTHYFPTLFSQVTKRNWPFSYLKIWDLSNEQRDQVYNEDDWEYNGSPELHLVDLCSDGSLKQESSSVFYTGQMNPMEGSWILAAAKAVPVIK